ncbi:Uncharacterised protein [Klebsiella pneumoniae]|nr:Uncharacterised protein [Klebsiella pneumoniae]
MFKFSLGDADDIGIMIHHNGPGAGSALVKRNDIFFVGHSRCPVVRLQRSFMLSGGRGGALLLFLHAGVARQVTANQLTIAECAQRRADHRCAQRHQEIRNIFAAGEGDVTPPRQPGEGFRADVTRRVHGEAGQRSHGGANHRNQQANQQRGQRAARYAVAIVGQRQDDAHQDSGNHHLYREGLHKIDVRVRVSGENAGQIEAFHAAANHMVGGFIIEEKIVVKPVN